MEALAERAAISVANASQHLQILRAARLIDAEKKGLRTPASSTTAFGSGLLKEHEP